MKDFASAAMMRLIQAGLAKQGLARSPPSAGVGAHVPLATKREGVERILAAHGPLALLRIGEALPDMREAPLLAALESAKSPREMVERWRRMEAYVHSKHRTEVVAATDGEITLRHISLEPGGRPFRSEDLLIFGVLVAVIGLTGVMDVRAKPVGEDAWIFDGAWGHAPLPEACAEWRICWTEATFPEVAAQPDLRLPTLQQLILADPMKRWSISQAARELGMSTRSLQRRLQRENKTFSQVITDIRAATAVRLLDRTDMSLSEIGFLSGFADQAHFTRSFKSVIAITPKQYRTRA